MNIVIIDDDTALLRSLELLLMSKGHEVTVFAEAVEAFSAIALMDDIDVVISDFRMPEVDGFSVLRAIKRICRGNITTILLSGHTDILETCSTLECCVDHYLPKPVDFTLLQNVLSNLRGEPDAR